VLDIPTIKLNTEARIPIIGFGTWNLAEGDEVVGAVSDALTTGYRLIDTAKVYSNEHGVGEAVRKSSVPREEIFVTTKLWPGDYGYEGALKAFEDSLQRLGFEYVDLYLLHWPGKDSGKRQEAWQALLQIHKEGRAKNIGVSNYSVEHLEELLKSSEKPPAVNQIEFHPYIYEEQRPILEFCKKYKVVVEAYSPLSGGHALNSITLTDIAERMGKSPAQVLIRWAIQHGTIPIPKSATPERIKSNIKVFDFSLSPADMNNLDELSR